MEKKYSIDEIKDALIERAWDSNATRAGVKPLLIVYPNEVLAALGVDLDKHYINNDCKE